MSRLGSETNSISLIRKRKSTGRETNITRNQVLFSHFDEMQNLHLRQKNYIKSNEQFCLLIETRKCSVSCRLISGFLLWTPITHRTAREG